MIAILMIVATSVALCMIFDRKLYETLPPAMFIVTLAVYFLALILPLNVSVWIVAGVVFAGVAALGLRLRLLNGKGLTALLHKRVGSLFFLPVLFVVCAAFCVLLSNRRVFYYDDLSYWALYTKNIFTINRLPRLFENCSVNYKDYTPIIQILQYMVMFGRKSFSEPILFQTNVCFIYILLLPMLGVTDDKNASTLTKIISTLFYVIFPHILTAQFYYRLGVDLFLALTFGYVLYYSFLFPSNKGNLIGNKDEMFRIGCILAGLAFMALVKSSGIVLCVLAIIMFAVEESMAGEYSCNAKKYRTTGVKTMSITVLAFGSYLSWQLFLHYSWNNGYLSNRVKANAMGEGLEFPAYTREVVGNYVNHFLTYPLTRNRFGVTAFMLTIFIIAVYIMTVVTRRRAGKSAKLYSVLFASSTFGLMIFCAAHISMYLFVFDEWEAHGLMEYDRYITQYLGGIFYVFVCLMMCDSVGYIREFGTEHKTGENYASIVLAAVSLGIYICLLPYGDMKDYLVPGNYKVMFDSEYGQMAKAASDEWNSSGIIRMNLSHDGSQRLTVIANEWDETTQFFEYESVPQPIDRILNVPAVEEGDLVGFIYEYMESYMYVAKGAKAAYVGNWEETAEVTEDNTPLREGTLYRVNRLNDVKTLSPVY